MEGELSREEYLTHHLTNTIHRSRLGGATMKTPAANFTEDGLARLFSYSQNSNVETAQDNSTETAQGNKTGTSQSNNTDASQGNKTEAPANTGHKQTAVLAGTLGGIVALAILVGLGCYVAREKVLATEDETFEKDGDPIVPRKVVELVERSELPVQDGSLPLRDG